MNLNKIVKETVNSILKEECLLMEYKNPMAADKIRVYTDGLEEVYNDMLSSGVSRREVNAHTLYEIIAKLRELERLINM